MSFNAFPGAEGWGASTPGGRNGEVINVTNLDPSGPGSLAGASEVNRHQGYTFIEYYINELADNLVMP